MHGKTKKTRDNWYSACMCKAKRMVRYVAAIISREKFLTNLEVCHIVSRLHPEFDEVTWDFVNLVRDFNYKHFSEEALISELLTRGYIAKIDLHTKMRRR
jgi:hypothetical protein